MHQYTVSHLDRQTSSLNSASTNPKVGGSKAVGSGDVSGGGGVGVEGIDVGEQGAHHGRDAGTHVLGGQTGKVPDRKTDRHEALEH